MMRPARYQPPGAALFAQFRSEALAIRHCVSASRAFLVLQGAPAAAAQQAELVLAEVLNNIAEHAYRGDRPGWIGMTLLVGPHGANVRVWDRGSAMPCERLPKGTLPDPALMPEGGFGWHLIQTLSEQLDYRHEGGLNRLSFTLPLR